MTWKEIEAILKRPFDDNEINWKLKTVTSNGKALLLAYMDARGVRDRLDEAFGPHWMTSYCAGPSGGVMCTLSVKWDGEWVSRCGVAENTNIEAVKGGASDALKRAATAYGIGRHLYDLGATFATIQDKANYDVESGRSVYCKGKGYAVAPSIRVAQPHLFNKPAPKPKATKAKAAKPKATKPKEEPKPKEVKDLRSPQPPTPEQRDEYINELRGVCKSRELSREEANMFIGLCTAIFQGGELDKPGCSPRNLKEESFKVLRIAVRKGRELDQLDDMDFTNKLVAYEDALRPPGGE